MTVPDLLLLPLYLLALGVPFVGIVLTWKALKRPRITALSWCAGFVDVVGVLIPTYVVAVVNSALEYPLPKEFGQVILRGVIIALGLVCVYFFYLYRTGRFSSDAVDIPLAARILREHGWTVIEPAS